MTIRNDKKKVAIIWLMLALLSLNGFSVCSVGKKTSVSSMAPGFVLIKSDPTGASVFINGKDTGKKTPFQTQLEEGSYNFTVKYEMYHNYEEQILVIKGQTITKNYILKPSFGNIRITSEPSGADIKLDGVSTNRKTPSTLEKISSGDHTISISKDMYSEKSEKITVNDELTKDVFIELQAGYGTIGIVARPAADIVIDGNKAGSGNYFARLSPGMHKLVFTRENYYSQQQEISVAQGQEETINIELKPITGSITIMVDPPESAIYLNEKYYGLSPKIIDSLIIGDYSMMIEKSGFALFRQKIKIEENKNLQISNSLQPGKLVNVVTRPDSAEVLYNGKTVGYSPVEFTVKDGNNMITLRKKYYSEKEVSLDAQNNGQVFTYNLEIDRQKVTIGITTNPGKSSIKLDEKPFLSGGFGYSSGAPQTYFVTSPNKMSIPVGKYSLKIEKKGFSSLEKELFVEKDINVEYNLRPLKYRTKGTAILLSLAWPGAGQSYLNRGSAHFLMGFAGYGALAYSFVQHSQAVKNYDLYLAENNPQTRESLKEKYQKNLKNSDYSMYAGAAVWGLNLIWTMITPSEEKRYKNVQFSMLNSAEGIVPAIRWRAEF